MAITLAARREQNAAVAAGRFCIQCGNRIPRGKESPSRYLRKLFCSTECWAAKARHESTQGIVKPPCPVCETPIVRGPRERADSFRKRKYCSEQCAAIGHRKYPDTQAPICEHCHQPIPRPLYDALCRWLERRFCSTKCAALSQENKINRLCLYCEQPFQTVQSQIKARGGLYCSKPCAVLGRTHGVSNPCLTCGK